MTPTQGVSIRLYLAGGSPAGMWIVEKSNWTGVALMWPRAIHTEARQRPELQRAGVYVLIGPSETTAKQRVYIGEADVLRNRLDQQHANRDFWTRAIVFTTKDSSLNRAHARHLESRLVELAQHAIRDEVANGNVPQRPALTEAETADVEAFLDEMLLIYPILDVRAFERIEARPEAGPLRVAGPGANATGDDTPEGFVVRAGSTARSAAVPSVQPWITALRTQLVEEGVLVADGDRLRFTTDYVFASPSSAAAVVLGRSANGRTEWRNESGKTLKEIQTESVTLA